MLQMLEMLLKKYVKNIQVFMLQALLMQLKKYVKNILEVMLLDDAAEKMCEKYTGYYSSNGRDATERVVNKYCGSFSFPSEP